MIPPPVYQGGADLARGAALIKGNKAGGVQGKILKGFASGEPRQVGG